MTFPKGDEPRVGDMARFELTGRVRETDGHHVTVRGNHETVRLNLLDAVPEVLERADDPTIGEIRAVAPSLDGKAKTAVKVGGRLSDTPGERCLWVIVETGEVLKDGDVTGLGEVIGTVRPDSSRLAVRVPNEPHGIRNEDREVISGYLKDGYLDRAVTAAFNAGVPTREQARVYVEDLPEYQTYLEQRADKPTNRDLCTKDECPGGTRCSSGATVWHDRTPECGDAS